MSNHLISACYAREVGGMARKAVMVLMADKASDDGRGIYASKQTMADELGTTKQTIIATIKALIGDGLLREVGHREAPNGFTVEYAIDMAALLALPLVAAHRRRGSNHFTGQAALPVKQRDQTGQAALPHRSSSLTQTPLKPSKTQGGRASAPDPAPDDENDQGEGKRESLDVFEPVVKVSRKPLPLPAGWTPWPIEELPPMARDLVRQWPAGAYEAVSECFRLHWRDSGERKDWRAVFAKWLIADHGKVMRDAKAGVSYAALAPAVIDSAKAAPVPETPAKARENHLSAAVHAALGTIGEHWARRLACCALIVNDDGDDFGLTVIAPSEFQSTWIEANCRPALNSAIEEATGAFPSWMKFAVERPAAMPRKGKADA